jgi:hypothetical protein
MSGRPEVVCISVYLSDVVSLSTSLFRADAAAAEV